MFADDERAPYMMKVLFIAQSLAHMQEGGLLSRKRDLVMMQLSRSTSTHGYATLAGTQFRFALPALVNWAGGPPFHHLEAVNDTVIFKLLKAYGDAHRAAAELETLIAHHVPEPDTAVTESAVREAVIARRFAENRLARRIGGSTPPT